MYAFKKIKLSNFQTNLPQKTRRWIPVLDSVDPETNIESLVAVIF